MNREQTRCLILACGNTLRSDDGVGPWLAEWAQNKYHAVNQVCIISRQQWTPELAEEIANAHSVLFIDCSIDSVPGSIHLAPVVPAAALEAIATHHQSAAALLALTRDIYSSQPTAKLLTIGAASTELGEQFSEAVTAALPKACRLIEETILHYLNKR